MIAPTPSAADAVEVHHAVPRCLLRLRDRADERTELDGEGIQRWMDYECEALRFGVDPDTPRDELAAMIDRSAVEIPRQEHRRVHACDFARWGRLEGLATARRHGQALRYRVDGTLGPPTLGEDHRGGAGGGLRRNQWGAVLMASPQGAPLFDLGRVVATPGAMDLLVSAGESSVRLLERHTSGDWGEVPPEDARENERSLKYGFRIVSSYLVGEMGKRSGSLPRPTAPLRACCCRASTSRGGEYHRTPGCFGGPTAPLSPRAPGVDGVPHGRERSPPQLCEGRYSVGRT